MADRVPAGLTAAEGRTFAFTVGIAFGLFGAIALFGGTSLYLAGHAFFWRRVAHRWLPSRLIGAAVLLALIPVAAGLPSLAAIAVATALCVAVVIIETLTYSREGADVRRHEPTTPR